MVMSSHRQPPATEALLQFLQRRLGLSPSALELGQRQAELEQAPLPIVLVELWVVEFAAVGRRLRLAEQSAVAQQRFHGLARR
jgi:hypothetical protein